MAKSPSSDPAQQPPQPSRKRGRVPVDPNETSRQRFVRVGGGRLAAVLDDLRMLGQIGNHRAAYEYREADISTIHAKVTQAFKACIEMLQSPADGQKVRESLFE